VRERVVWADDPDGWEDDPAACEYDERPARAALRALPSRFNRDDPDLVESELERAGVRALPSRFNRDDPSASEDIVVLRCGASRHRHPPRLGELFGTAVLLKRTQGPHRDRRRWVSVSGHTGLHQPRSVRFPCRDDCPADWNIDTARLVAAYRQAVASGRRTLVFGVDL
jgi:hypothetical protein